MTIWILFWDAAITHRGLITQWSCLKDRVISGKKFVQISILFIWWQEFNCFCSPISKTQSHSHPTNDNAKFDTFSLNWKPIYQLVFSSIECVSVFQWRACEKTIFFVRSLNLRQKILLNRRLKLTYDGLPLRVWWINDDTHTHREVALTIIY